MFSKIFSATTVALAASSLVSAQTFTKCDPTKKDCPADPAFGETVEVDFTKGESDVFDIADGTTLTYDGGLGAVFAINKETEAPTITSHKYIFFGKVEVVCRASYGTGVVTSFVLQSDDLDEIDWEWLGGDTAQVQTNYFSKGDTTTYDRGGFSPVANPQDEFHTYTIEWTPDRLDWIINGAVVRTLTYADAKGGASYPQSPMQVKMGTWVAGRKDAPEGTVQWAGGYTNFADAPFKGYYQKVTITDYAGGSTAANGGIKEYVYGDKTGTWQSIQVVKGDSTDDSSSSSSGSSTATSTKDSSTKTGSSTLSTAITQATGASNATVANATTTSRATAAQGTSSSSSTATGAPQSAGGVKSGASAALMGAALLVAYFAL